MSQRRRPGPTARAATAVAVLATALAACSGSDGAATSEGGGKAAAGVISLADARAVLRNYVKVNNAANATRDAEKTATIESGAMLAQSQAGFRQYPAWSEKEQEQSKTPFSYPVGSARFYIPRKGSADFFMVNTAITGEGIAKDRRRLIVFKSVVDEKAKGGKGWRAVTVGEVTGKPPAVDVDGDGFATPLAATGRVGSLPLGDLVSLSQDFYVTGGTKAAASFADTTAVKDWKKAYADRAPAADKCVDGEYAAGSGGGDTAYGMKTEDGGALVLYDFGVQYKNWGKADCGGGDLKLKNLPVISDIYLDGRTSVTILTRTESLMALAVVPPSGKKVQVTGYQERLTSAQ
ncbi:hypothetical protein ABZ848_25075 [Streptomyces sp. NPDC047081]|uniref:hypothetical protein n=1 Tax=Streptomyces sp. NPDC047081 TaxID=3154706 RepID=UPI00340B5B13